MPITNPQCYGVCDAERYVHSGGATSKITAHCCARKMFDRVDALTCDIAELTIAIEAQMKPYAAQVIQLDEVTGIGATCRSGDHR